jgi:RND family efflux transporter MFP subunit
LLLGTIPAAAEAPIVAVGEVSRSDASREVSFEAELRPYQEIEVHAKVTGYLETLDVDIGDVLTEGQEIAKLEVPELKVEIEHALAEQRRAEAEVEKSSAAFDEMHLSFTRLQATDHSQPHLLAPQDLDSSKAHDRSAAAGLASAKEQAAIAETEVKRLRTLLDYARITAPFAGVVTKRYADTGALIQSGTSTGALPVVRLSQNDKLRAVFPVSISFVSGIRVGDPVELRLAGVDRIIEGTVSRFERKVDTSTRTMEVEVDVPNPDLSLLPGLYAEAILKVERRTAGLFVPMEAVTRAGGGKSSVYIVNKEHRIEERKVTLGLETPNKIEILSGAREGEMVLLGSRSQLVAGQSVEPKLISSVKMN